MYSLPQYTRVIDAARAKAMETRLTEVEQSIAQLQSQLDTLKIEQDFIKTRLNYQRNAITAPISRLPVEILGKIFEHYIGDTSRHLPYLLLTCREWYEVVQAFPALWTHINLDDAYDELDGLPEAEESFMDACYENSSSLGLHVIFNTSNINPADLSDDELVDAVCMAWSVLEALLSRDISRWRNFQFISPNSSIYIEDCCDYNPNILNNIAQRGVNLESLLIDDGGGEFTCVLRPPITSLLSSMTLHDATWDWNMRNTLFPDLTHLYVSYRDNGHWETAMGSCGKWLQVFPKLKHLTLGNYGEYEDFSYVGRSLVVVPTIKTLHLIGRIPHTLLDTLRLPSLETLVIQYGPENPTSFEDATRLLFAKEVKSLIVQDDPDIRKLILNKYDPKARRFSKEDLPVRLAGFLVSTKNRLQSVTIEKQLCTKIGLRVKKAKKATTLPDGIEAYSWDVGTFAELLRKIMPVSS
jgi:hypothetical protein